MLLRNTSIIIEHSDTHTDTLNARLLACVALGD